MKSFYEKAEYSFADIQMLIETQAEENVYLEFKAAGALEKDQRKTTDISKDVAAMGNSDGGIIIYGIKEKDHKAHSVTFIDGNLFTKEWLEQVINSGIQRQIPGIEIVPIRVDQDISKSLYVVKIPRSSRAPHMSDDHKFYKRNNFQAVAMHEYEVRDLYDRKTASKLAIDDIYVAKINSSIPFTDIELIIVVANDGDIFEPNYKLGLYLEQTPSTIDYDFDQNKVTTTYLAGKVKISTNDVIAIYPGEALAVMRVGIRIKTIKFYEELAKVKCHVLLFFGKQSVKHDFNLVDVVIEYTQPKADSGLRADP